MNVFAMTAGLGVLGLVFETLAAVTVSMEPMTLPTYPYGDPDPVATEKSGLYPYFRYDGQSAVSRPQKWDAVKLSNGRIELTMIPAIGGKVWGAKDLRTGRDFIYANDAVKFRDIAMRGPWCSGGIEFNFGITGHAPWTVSPVDWTVRENADGSASYFFGGYEFVTRTFWQVEVLLRPDEDFFTTKLTWHNGGGQPCTRYQWSTSAVTARGNPEMVYPGSDQIDHDGKAYPWPLDNQGVNRAIYANDDDLEAVSWHVINGDNRFFGIWYPGWQLGMWHRNAAEDKFGRKIFMWSQARSGGIWEDLLTDAAGQYIELQSGRGMQQQVGGCEKTPFKFQTLVPGMTDVFEEQWGVAHDTKPYDEAKAFPCRDIARPLAFPKDYDTNSVYALYRDGEQKMRYGMDVVGAAKLLEKALEKDPCFVPALGELAAFEFRRGNVRRAEELAEKALAVDTYDGPANFIAGEIALDRARLERARERFGVAALDAGYRPAALVRLGMIAIREKDYALAGALAEKALASSAYDPEAHQLKAVAARLGGDRAVGKAAVAKGMERTPIHYGLRYEKELLVPDKRRDAASPLEVRCELPGPTLVETGLWYAKAGLDEDAKKIWAAAPKDPVAKLLSGDLDGAAALPVDFCFPHGREVIAALERSVRSHKGVKAHPSWKFKYYLAIALAPFGESERVDCLLEACGDEPDAAAFYLFRAARRTGEKAISDLERAAKCGDSWRVGCALAKAYLKDGKPNEAFAAVNAYRTRYPGMQQLDSAAANALVEAGRWQEALDILSKINVLPSEFNKAIPRLWNRCHRELAEAAFKAGDKETVRRHVDAALSFPENLGDGRPVDPESVLKDWPKEVKALRSTPVRPYEMTLAARDRDEFPSVAKLEGAEGWRAVAQGGSARLETTTERTCFGKGSCRFFYKADSSNAVFRLESTEPIAVPKDADTVTLWVYGNNYNGRAGYASGRVIPELKLRVEFALGREKASVKLWKIRHPEWFMPMGVMDARTKDLVARGAKVSAIVFEGGPSVQEEQLDLNSLCVFRDPQRPLAYPPRRTLPFPTTELGIVPASAEETVEFRYPAKPNESWDDLAFRVKGGEWIPLAVGGGIWPEAARKGAKVVFSRHGDSVIADVEVAGGVAEEVRFGAAKLPAKFERVPIPYYTYCERDEKENRPWMLSTTVGGAPLFVLASMDWNRSAASCPLAARESSDRTLAVSNGGAEYLKRTDGTRHNVCERFVWSVSRDPQKVLPEIPNPPSPYKALVGSSARCVLPSGDHAKDLRTVASWKRRGLERLILTDHEVMWRDGNESFTFRTIVAPGKGGDKAHAKYTRDLIDGLGIHYGPYNNYTDFAPVNRWWSIDNVTRASDGSPVQAWYRCYAPKPVWSAMMNAIIAPRVQRKFGFTCAYCDVHTCIAPWDRTDYDSRVPGAGTYGETMRAYADILLTQRETWKGPVCSEGGIQFLYSGLHDNSYAQDAQYGLSMRPWLVDFDLLKMHDLNVNCGAGLVDQFYCWWRTMDETDPQATSEWRQSRWIAATLAFGHSALLDGGKGLAGKMRAYFAVQGIASKYTVAKAAEIRYGGADGQLHTTAEAVASGDYRRSQVRVAYDDGTVVAANGSRTDDFAVQVGAKTARLPPNGWYAVSGDGKAASFSGVLDGQRVEYACSPDYTYVNGFGKPVRTPYGATDGILVRRTSAEGEEAVVEGATYLEVPYAVTRAEALDETSTVLGEEKVEVRGTSSRIAVRKGAVSCRLRNRR